MIVLQASDFHKVLLLFLLIFVRAQCDFQYEETMGRLDEMLTEVKTQRYSRGIEDGLKIWQKYEFGTGAGNREELIVTSIDIDDEETLRISEVKYWQFTPGLHNEILAGSKESRLWMYFHGNKDGYVHDHAVLTADGKILTFKVINVLNRSTNHEDIVVVLYVESGLEAKLIWYKAGNRDFKIIWSSLVSKRVERLDYFQHNGRNKLLLVNEPINYDGAAYSSIEIYEFKFVGDHLDLWLCQRIWMPKVSGLEICSIYESTFLTIQSQNMVSLYEFKESETKEGLFTHLQNLTSNGLKNSICFENGYTEYLIISGQEPALFTFLENEFLYDTNVDKLFTELGETSWVQCLPVNTYREECLLLVQLKNLTVIGLSWQGDDFKITDLTPLDIDNFELSKITVIPKYGFIFEDKIYKVEARLQDLARPVHDQMEKMLDLKNSLEETFLKQESILDETDERIKNSYYSNPVVTGFWNISEVDTQTATIGNNVAHDSLQVGSKLFTAIDVATDLTVFDKPLRELDEKIAKIRHISSVAWRANSPEVYVNSISLNGGIEVLGTLHVKNLTFKSLNGFTVEDIMTDFVKYDNENIIKGIKSFPAIDANTINIVKINGVPFEDIKFHSENIDYENINFTALNQLVVNGSLNFSSVNGIVWQNLMKSVVWKNRPAVIPGLTIVRRDIVADAVSASTLNGLKYPDDYVLQNSKESVEIFGKKIFQDIKVVNLKGIKRINGIPFEDFVTLNEEQILPHEITFANLEIDEILQIDGVISGIKVNQEEHRLTLNDINVITADTMFTNLHVTGNIIVENSVNEWNLFDFDDIIRKSDDTVVITGQKTFLGNVEIKTKLKVTSKKYNGHPIDEFVTLSGEQVFPNLKRISAPVTFDQLEYKQLTDLQNYFNDFVNNTENSICSKKKLIFKVSPVFTDISFDTLNGNISSQDFFDKYFQTLENVTFENLEVKTLYAIILTANSVNSINIDDFENRRISISNPQILTGNYTVRHLKARELKTYRINDNSIDDLEKFRNDFEDLFDRIWNGKMVIDTFIVKGRVQTNTINGKLLANIYARNKLRNVIVEDGFYVRNLEVRGFVNGLNLTEYALDSVYKTELNVVLTGEKVFDTLNSEILAFAFLNGNPIENILNPKLVQTLTGPVLVKGNVVVEKSFGSDGKVNDVVYKNLIDRIAYFGNYTFELHGDFWFSNDVLIENLLIDGPVQGINFDSFLKMTIFQGDDVNISGTKIFNNSVTFRQNLTIVNKYNGIDLVPFNDKAVLIDRDVHIDCELIFEDDLIIGGDLIVEEHFDSKTVSKVDIEELKSSAIFLDRPSYVQGTLTFANAIFESKMTVDYLNGIDLNAVISLKENEIIFHPLSFVNLSVDTLEVTGTVNGYDTNEIFFNTFMLYGNQTVKGNLIFHGNVQMQNNFDPKSINGIDTSQMISLDEDEKLSGDFKFSRSLILKNDLRVFGLVNDIDLARWESGAVYDSFPKTQLVSGNWMIRGNVIFEKDVLGNGLLNGIAVQRLSDELEKRNLMMNSIVTGVKMDLASTCKDLIPLQKYAKNQIHRFEFFEYFQIMDFDILIKSIHHFGTDGGEFLLINLEQCFLNIFSYNSSGFNIITSEPDFDNVEKWTTLNYEDHIYLLTIGNGMCGKSIGNLWKFEEQTLTHILDLGRITDVKKIGDYLFLVISQARLEKWSIKDVLQGLYGNLTSYFTTNEHMQFVPNTDRILLVEDNYIHEFHPQYLNHTSSFNHLGNGAIMGLKAGIFEREMFLYYDEGVSENNAFIFDGLSGRKIRQSIPTHNPKSFLTINFDSFVETFLTFVKNGRSLEIYEYRGIEGFVYRESIKMQIDKTFGFKFRKHSGLSKTNFVGATYGNTLTILEAKMYGEKLDVEYLICED